MTIEGEEESGSGSFMHYYEQAVSQLKNFKPELLIGLDTRTGNYDNFWLVSSLRGMIKADIHVKVLTEGTHSGDASGIIPSSFRIMRQLLDR